MSRLRAFGNKGHYLRNMPGASPIRGACTWLLLLFALTAMGTLSARYGPHERIAFALDLVPFIGAAVIGALVATRLLKARVDPVPVGYAAYSCAACALISALGIAHLTSVIAEAAQGPFVYDFRTYALILLGALLIVPGYCGVVYASRSVYAHASTTRPMALVWSCILCVNAPLIPLQGFAVLFTALGGIGLLMLWLLRKALAGRVAAP